MTGSGALAGYRMLDLTDEKGSICGKLFGDLGAEVIKVEPPEGCTTRRIGPFYPDAPDPERSLYFASYSAGKKSITLDLRLPEARSALRELAGSADFVVESYPVGYLAGLGLGYADLGADNPGLMHCSITPFGDRGPGATWKAADITVWAAGGMMFLTGRPDQAPLAIGFAQAGLHAGCEAAVSCLLALGARSRTGLGQHVAVDMQACVAWCLLNESGFPPLHGDFLRRNAGVSGSGPIARRTRYRCADGFVAMSLSGGSAHLHTAQEIVRWMDEHGEAPDWLKKVDFTRWTARESMTAAQETIQLTHDCETLVETFLGKFTRAEIYRVALERRLLISPVSTMADVAVDQQLISRGFFDRTVPHPASGVALRMPGPFARMSATPVGPARPAPLLGQHNPDILEGELKLSPALVARLSGATR